MIEGVNSIPCESDVGSDRESRSKPCSLRTWCVDVDGHPGNCTEAPRGSHPAPDFGPKRKR